MNTDPKHLRICETLSLLSYCKAFKIDPDWMIRIAGMVESGQLKEDQAIEMFMRWSEFKPVIDNACQIALDGIMGMPLENPHLPEAKKRCQWKANGIIAITVH
jgi:hypothetical protein